MPYTGPVNDEFWMKKALRLAEKAALRGEVPVGALIVKEGQLLSQAFNRREELHSTLGHAEILAMHRASEKLQSWRLLGCTLYVTLEPCLMCAGALLQSRIPRLVYGTKDPKGGAVSSLYTVLEDTRLNHQVQVTSGVCEREAGFLLSRFFKELRSKTRS